MASKYAEILRQVEIFANLDDAELDRIGDMLKERRFQEDQVIFKRGDRGDQLLIIAGGRVKLSVQESDREKVLAFYGAGDVFGEMGLLTGEPRSATAIAVSETRTLALSKEDFDDYVSTNVVVMREMMRIISQRQAETIQRLTLGGDMDMATSGAKSGKVYAVFSPRGGSGKTTIAVNLAVSLAQIHPEQAALLDLSLTFPHCALLLNVVPKGSLAGLSAESLAKIDREGMDYYMVRHASTLKVFVGSTRAEEGEIVSGDQVRAAIDILRRFNANVVIDTPSNFHEPTIAALESADRVLMVCTPELTTLRDVRECQRIFSDVIKVQSDRLVYVMNNVLSFKPLAPEQFAKALEQNVDTEIPYGSDVPAKAVTRGQAFVQTQPGANIAKAIERLARSLDTEHAAAAAKPERKSLFARR
jgi:CRP-like cAMP-binding protein